jgi:hypothetical protein
VTPRIVRRASALCLILNGVAGIVDAIMSWQVAAYVGVLSLLMAVASAATALRLWVGDALLALTVATVVLALQLVGHSLAKTIGLPGASALSGPPGTWEVVFVALQLIILVGVCWQLWERALQVER